MAKKKTHEEFVRDLNKIHGEGVYIPLEKYKGANIKILVKHNCKECNYHEWEIIPSNILKGSGCPICGRKKVFKKITKTHEEFVKEIKDKYGDEYNILGKYINNYTKIKVRHNKCGYEWYPLPNNLLKDNICSKCSGIKKKTTKEFKREIYELYGNEYEVLGEYINAMTKILVKHKCGYKWNVIPSNLLRGQGCPKCAGNIKKTTEEFKKEIYDKYGNEYEILGEYKKAMTKIKVRHNCKKCHYHEWNIRPNDLLHGNGCPVCGGNRKVVLGINTIWDTDRWMVDLGVSEEDAKKYKSKSQKKIIVKCPDCGREKKIAIYDICTSKSIRCSCGNGKSYPEKFVMNILEQLDIEFETEYKPKWSNNKRYDFYIKNASCIIETHGEQHYNGSFEKIGGRILKEERANDKYKGEIALANEIKYYIELDCKESKLEYIKNSILNSELNDLFDLSKVNWTNCAEFANKNIVKEVCDYWNNKRDDETTTDISIFFNLNYHTIWSYLKRGRKLGWCNYDPKKERRKVAGKNGKMNGEMRSKKVEIFKAGSSLGIFNSVTELERKSEELFGIKLINSNISMVSTGKKRQYKGFTFKYVD
ncbi:hypothetical protein FJ641_04030 [Clostridium perfringens]|nr:hypothetical protein [Clostridium perfringens]